MIKKTHTIFFIFISLMISISFFGCTKTTDTSNNITAIEITPLLNSISVGAEIQLSATSFLDNGEKQNATNDVEWRSSDNSIFKVTSEGKLKPLTAGSGEITATLNAITSSISLTVNSAVLVSLSINPANPQIYAGTEITLEVFGLYNDGSKINLTDTVTWESETTPAFSRKNNVITGLAAGTKNITASYGDISSSTTVSVSNATLKTILIELDSNTYYAGNTINLRAIGVFSDGKKYDISQQVDWSYVAPTSLPITYTNNTITVKKDGELLVSATLIGVTSSTTIKISPATLEELYAFSPYSTIAAGEVIQLQAFGYYSDERTVDLTDIVTWASSDNSILEVSNAINFEGKAISKTAGKTVTTATYKNFSQDININVTDATLSAISITSQRQNMAKGTSLSLIATGIYSDNTTINITDFVNWSSEDPSVIHVNNQTQSTGSITSLTSGLATGLALGTTKVFAQLGNISSNAEITVTAATLIDLFINNITPDIIINTTLSLEAIGIFSDGVTQNITDKVLWDSNNTDVAAISNGVFNSGVLEAITIGTSNISATFNNVTVTEAIKVSNATLTEIILEPNTLTIAEGISESMQAIGRLSNGLTQNITSLVNWSSDAPTLLSINNAPNKKGEVFALGNGTANITAKLGNVTASKKITITNATLTSIEVSQLATEISNNTELVLTATGIYSNGSYRNITRDVLWQSNNATIVFVSNAENENGLARALAVGDAIISAIHGNTTGSTKITVTPKTLTAITLLSNSNGVLAAGNEVQLTAIGNYSDGSTLDISHQVTWQSSDNTICVVTTAENSTAPATTSKGLLKTKTAGNCSVTARFEDVSNALIFTVNSATLQSIVISPDNISLAKGTLSQLTATGFYSDNTSSNISQQVSWDINNTFNSITNGTNSDISSNTNSRGLIRANDVGTSIITARFQDITDTTNVTVTPATLESITITAKINGDFNAGTIKTFIATGTYSDQNTQNITQQVLWGSSDTSIATANNADVYSGRVTGLIAGNITLNANLNDITSNALAITIIDNPLAPVSLALQATPFVILNDGTDASDIAVNIQAVDSLQKVPDGTTVDFSIITGEGTLSTNSATSVNGIATFNFTSTTKGLVTIKASIANTEIVNYVSLYATDSFSEVVARYGFASGALTNNLVDIGSQFGMLLFNASNREFVLNSYSVYNGSAAIIETSDATILNNNILPAGGTINIVYTTTEALSNNYIIVYSLTEPKTGQQFTLAGGFQLN